MKPAEPSIKSLLERWFGLPVLASLCIALAVSLAGSAWQSQWDPVVQGLLRSEVPASWLVQLWIATVCLLIGSCLALLVTGRALHQARRAHAAELARLAAAHVAGVQTVALTRHQSRRQLLGDDPY